MLSIHNKSGKLALALGALAGLLYQSLGFYRFRSLLLQCAVSLVKAPSFEASASELA